MLAFGKTVHPPPHQIVKGDIYICGFSRGNGTLHWSLGVGIGTEKKVMDNGKLAEVKYTVQKIHITNREGGWTFKVEDEVLYHVVYFDVPKGAPARVGYGACCIVSRIGRLVDFRVVDLINILKATAPEEADPENASYNWVEDAIQSLNEAKVVYCPNHHELMEGLKDAAEKRSELTEQGFGFRYGVRYATIYHYY
ncbi:hypothetical protein FRC17_007246 [Serendipita sp. 399]|nr:hypothetical protein FRC17_007246 [Serendipita sp. 399]